VIIRAPAAVITVVCGLFACTTASQAPVGRAPTTGATVSVAETPPLDNMTDGSHRAVLYERYQSPVTPNGPIILDVSVYKSTVLSEVFAVRLTHTGNYDDDFRNVRVVFDSPSPKTKGLTEDNGVSMNLLPSSQFEVLANHIGRTATIEVRLGAANDSIFHVAEASMNSTQLSLTQ
jgi:hypothetical protein